MTFFTRLSYPLILSFTLSILLIGACSNENQSNSNDRESIQIPELLDRNAKIQLGNEWDYVQNFYVEQREAVKQDPNDYDAILNLAQLFVKEARVTGEHGHYYPAALRLTDYIIKANPESEDLVFRTLTTKAGVELSQHEFSQALKTGLKAVNINPENAGIYGVLVDAYVELGDYEKAIIMADKMMSIKPDLRSYSRVSYLREIHGDVNGAIEAMQMAVTAGFPGYEETAWSQLTLGELYQTYGHTEKARLSYLKILENRPEYPFAIAALAEIDMENNQPELAEQKLNTAINIIPEVGFYVQLAEIYKIQNRTEEFNQITDEIFLMLEDDVQSGHNMNLEYANLYLNLLDQPEEALIYAKKEYKKRPKNIDVNRMLAQIYMKKELTDEAENYALAASTTDSRHPNLIALKNNL